MAARPLGYRFRLGSLLRDATISSRTTVTICFASFDDMIWASQSTDSSAPPGLAKESAEEQRRRY